MNMDRPVNTPTEMRQLAEEIRVSLQETRPYEGGHWALGYDETHSRHERIRRLRDAAALLEADPP